MKNETEKYVSNNEYTAEFRKKTVKSVLIVIGATAAISLIMITLALKTDFLYHTNFFNVSTEETVPIHAEKKAFSGEIYEFEIKKYSNNNGRITVILDAKADEASMNMITSDNIKLICYDSSGDKREEIITAIDSEKKITDISPDSKSCRFEMTFARYPGSSDSLDDIYCLRIFTKSTDGTVSILCNYNTVL
ncbi:MAG: hypothetical protein ACI4XF_00995 [Oscillospiraceae bacterium]